MPEVTSQEKKEPHLGWQGNIIYGQKHSEGDIKSNTLDKNEKVNRFTHLKLPDCKESTHS
jgi:hypothetical protein